MGHPRLGRREMTTLNVLRVRRRRRRQATDTHLRAQEPLLVLGSLLALLLVWILLGSGWAVLLAALGAAVAGIQLWARGGTYAPHPTRHGQKVADREKRVLRLGLLTLVLGPVLVFALSVPRERYQEWSAAAATPKPGDCDWTTPPLGDKHCHYEGSFTHINDHQGERVIIEWHRMYDY
jgi:hypothetical protein